MWSEDLTWKVQFVLWPRVDSVSWDKEANLWFYLYKGTVAFSWFRSIASVPTAPSSCSGFDQAQDQKNDLLNQKIQLLFSSRELSVVSVSVLFHVWMMFHALMLILLLNLFDAFSLAVGFGFLTFDNEDSVEQACAEHYVDVSGKQVTFFTCLRFASPHMGL